ncbi:hemerythrin domain-containing protein [Quadrisphaera sp. INWT6]|uniref:hemerythrin domain-containing protein n=1 Tax=Quadrisphaera sp. INWT6 TaxID=2596917 RepID=UPI001891FE0B|nr:hemerythrin domain-containing protein [Quadrisphaera sp. INWT6]MBF5082725.1 hemerythrin domain-containing protein [Quadrisphaera sp. INWT6]
MANPRRNGLTSVADQTEEQRGGPGSILSRQSADHRALDDLMRAHDAATDPDERGQVLAELGERALRHAFAEETVLFPAYRRHLPGAGSGDELTAHIEGDHQEVNDLLRDLQRTDPAPTATTRRWPGRSRPSATTRTTRRTTCCPASSRWPTTTSCEP